MTTKPTFSDSLSFGMRDALDQGCAHTITICCACIITDRHSLEIVINHYSETYWSKHPEAAEATRLAWDEGRILSPRAEGFHAPIGYSRQPLYADFKEWRTAVSEHAPDWSMGWCPHNCKVAKEQILTTKTPQELYRLFPKINNHG